MNECKCEEPCIPWPEGVFDRMYDGTCFRCGGTIILDATEGGLISKPEGKNEEIHYAKG